MRIFNARLMAISAKSFPLLGTYLHRIGLAMAIYFGYLLLTLWTLFPIAWMAVTSVKPPILTLTMPPVWIFPPTLEGYWDLFASSDFIRWFSNTIIIALGATVLVLVASLPASYAFSRFRFHFRTSLLFIIVAIRALPPVAAIVPLFLFYQRAGMMDTHLGLILLYASFFVSFAILIMKSFFDEIPVDLDEAAFIDGAGPFDVFRYILLPLVAPGGAATAIFVLVSSWNEFFFAFVFTARIARTAPVGLAQFVGETGIAWTQLAAGSITVTIPSLILIWLVQRHLVRGLMVGAIK